MRTTSRDEFWPTKSMLLAGAKGIRLLEEGYGGKGLMPETVQWVRMALAGHSLPYAKVKKMRNWFRRHVVDYRPGWSIRKTPGYIANLLWFGWDGWIWSEQHVARKEGDPVPANILQTIKRMKMTR